MTQTASFTFLLIQLMHTWHIYPPNYPFNLIFLPYLDLHIHYSLFLFQKSIFALFMRSRRLQLCSNKRTANCEVSDSSSSAIPSRSALVSHDLLKVNCVTFDWCTQSTTADCSMLLSHLLSTLTMIPFALHGNRYSFNGTAPSGGVISTWLPCVIQSASASFSSCSLASSLAHISVLGAT